MKTTSEVAKDKSIDQFIRRRQYAISLQKIDNAGLHAGSPMYFYCKYCKSPTEVLPEDYIFPPFKTCSQCYGLEEHGWIEEAVDLASKEGL